MAQATSEVEEIFAAGDTRLYSVYCYCNSDEMPPAIGSILINNSNELAVILSIECTNDHSDDNEAKIKGSSWCLILSDDKAFLSQASTQGQSNEIDSKTTTESKFSRFSNRLADYLSENALIPVKVYFEDKDEFKTYFSTRTSWDAKQKQWYLRHISSDFDALKLSSQSDVAICGNLQIRQTNFMGMLNGETKAKMAISYISHDQLRLVSFGYKSLQETIDERES